MKYFVTEQQRKQSGSSCYFEFQKGEYRGKCWLDNSLSIHDDVFDDSGLFPLFNSVTRFDYYGITEITKENWSVILKKAQLAGGKTAEVISELIPWATENFKSEGVFTVCGI